MDKLKMHSPDLTEVNIGKIAELFPAVITETLDADGNMARAVDFDLLRQELSDHIVEGPQERYQLDWPGKRESLFAANAPIAKTLRPVREESVDFNTTQNLFIEGDNLDALKLLQESYLGKVKLIYIDPPYNTGNDFIYDDDFAQTTAGYLERSGQRSDDGTRLVANAESNGRFHSDWLSMMYPRLRLARNLLTDDGFLCMSIDDAESANAKALLDDVFGPRNFVATIVWQKRYVSNVTARHLSDMHDFVHVYARKVSDATVGRWPLTSKQLEAYKNPDSDERGPWRAQDLSASKPYQAGVFTICQDGVKFDPPPNRYWRCNREQFEKWNEDGRIWWGVEGTARPMLKSFLNEKDATTTPHTWWDYERAGHNKEATLEMKALFDGASPFDTPKPVKLISRLLELFAASDSIVLDFFAGSSTTAHAVLDANAADDGQRNFVMIQLDEQVNSRSRLSSNGFATISALSRERIRRAAERMGLDAGLMRDGLDLGFRALRVDSTNMADVLRTPDATEQNQLDLSTDSVKPGRTAEDLLFQVLLDWGLELTMSIAVKQIDGHEVFIVDDGALVACFDGGVSLTVVRQIAERAPLRAVFRDSGFASDADRINAEQVFAEVSPGTEVKAI
ncbi:site-specific DNA-methyltransferase [Acidimicrobiales bacterium]|nr:site-specific DNA-methyltransferase [Acidimicrobiales bacterium]